MRSFPSSRSNISTPSRRRDWLANANDVKLVSRVRMGTVGIDLASLPRFAKSSARLARMAGKAMLKPDRGYYLFAKN